MLLPERSETIKNIMRYILIDQEYEINTFFENAFNPPVYDHEFSERDFDKEYWVTHSAIRDNLSIKGKFSYSREGDFAMNEVRGSASRWVSVVFTTNKMWTTDLIMSVQSVLNRQTHDYMIYFSHDIIEFPIFHILVSQASVLGCCDDLSIMTMFGFPQQ